MIAKGEEVTGRWSTKEDPNVHIDEMFDASLLSRARKIPD
jgi:hypothetical protein